MTTARNDGRVMYFGDVSASQQIRGVALGLEALTDRTDWWGSARIAFDAVLGDYRVRAHLLAAEAANGGA
jgi:hypothetical protein